jgi:hypothetical protein
MNFPNSSPKNPKSGIFIKLNDGEKVHGLFRGDPVLFKIHWINKKAFPCLEDLCEHCREGDKAKFRFRINIIVEQDKVFVAKIFENNYGVYKDLKALHENGYNLEETYVSITRQGINQSTKYSILPVKQNGGLTEHHLSLLSKIPLNELIKKDAR